MSVAPSSGLMQNWDHPCKTLQGQSALESCGLAWILTVCLAMNFEDDGRKRFKARPPLDVREGFHL